MNVGHVHTEESLMISEIYLSQTEFSQGNAKIMFKSSVIIVIEFRKTRDILLSPLFRTVLAPWQSHLLKVGLVTLLLFMTLCKTLVGS